MAVAVSVAPLTLGNGARSKCPIPGLSGVRGRHPLITPRSAAEPGILNAGHPMSEAVDGPHGEVRFLHGGMIVL